MASAVTATVQIQDFANWTGCSPQAATAALRATECPSCRAGDPADDGLDGKGPECYHLFHMRQDSGDWS